MVIFFIVVRDFIIKCVAYDITAQCTTVSPLVFGALAIAGALEVIYELKGIVTIFRKKPDDDDK